MENFMKKMLLTLASALLLSNAVMAADIAPVASVTGLQGSAVVARGDASLPLKQGMALLEGDKVAVLENSSMELAYADCAVSHQQNTVLDVSANAPCAQGQQFGTGGPAFLAAFGGLGVAGVIAAVVVVGVVVNEVTKDDKPASG
jgi:opacity protein-like surface antigen